MPGEDQKPTARPEIVKPEAKPRVLGLITALLPLATEFIVPAIEKAIGRKKSPEDKATGELKKTNGIGLLQQFSAMLGVSGTSDELADIIELAVKVLKPLGLDKLSENPSQPVPAGFSTSSPVQFTITGTGTMQFGENPK